MVSDWKAHTVVLVIGFYTIKGIKPDDVVQLPHLVGPGAPELGDHFILCVINATQKNIQIFGSLRISNTTHRTD